MRTITLTVWNRPAYTRQVLDSLRHNAYQGYTLVVGIDKDPHPEVVRMVNKIDWIPTFIKQHETKLGVHYNALETYKLAFGLYNSAFNVAIEDDSLLSKDALHLANWFERLDHVSPGNYECLGLFTHTKNSAVDPKAVVPCCYFNAMGYAFTKRFFDDILVTFWDADPRGWDYSIQNYVQQNNKLCLYPAFSRAKNIGVHGGAHMTPEFYAREMLDIIHYEGSPIVDFSVVADENKEHPFNV